MLLETLIQAFVDWARGILLDVSGRRAEDFVVKAFKRRRARRARKRRRAK